MTLAKFSGVGVFFGCCFCHLGAAVLIALLAEAADPDLSAVLSAATEDGGTNKVGSEESSFVAVRRCWMCGRSVSKQARVVSRVQASSGNEGESPVCGPEG